MKKAVIDLGTNTFHLLIANTDETSYFDTLYQERKYVFLAEEGLEAISRSARLRAIEACTHFKKEILKHQAESIIVTGTAALRTAANGPDLASRIEAIIQSKVHIISGEQEAFLIGKGVEHALQDQELDGLAVDIGGGSTEIVAIKSGKATDHCSKTCGIAFLYNRFHSSEPIDPSNLSQMERYIKNSYSDFISAIRHVSPKALTLIGVAGTFEVLQNLGRASQTSRSINGFLTEVDLSQIHELYEEVCSMDEAQRRRIHGLPQSRVKYFLEGLTIIKTLSELGGCDRLLVSSLSIKHGVMLTHF